MHNPLEDLPPIVANAKNLRWIHWQGDLASPLLTNFPQRTLCYLNLHDSPQKLLWEGRKNLPNLKILNLFFLRKLIMTPDFSGLPNLEIFKLRRCRDLEEVHSSLGDLTRLVTLSIKECLGIKVFPSITLLTNLKTLSFYQSPQSFGLSEIQQKLGNLPHLHLDNIGGTQVKQPGEDLTCFGVLLREFLFAVQRKKKKTCLPQNNMNHCIQLWFPHRDLMKLDLSCCHLGDEDIGSSVWELPNVQELDVGGNEFSQLDFSLLRVPKLKRLSVRSCHRLVALSDLPLSIAVVGANSCSSLETFGDISSCKWLWKVEHQGGYKLGLFDGGILLDSMLQGNAIEDHFISVCLERQIPMGFLGSFFGGKTFTKRLPLVRCDPNTMHDSDTFMLCLPPDWCNDFCGFLIRVVTQDEGMYINITMKQQEADEEDYGFEIWQESDEAPEPVYHGNMKTCVGYVSFNSLRRTTFLTSSYNYISFSIYSHWTSFTAELVPRKSVQTTQDPTDCSEFWNNSGFVIKYDSKSTVKISWAAC